MLTSPGHKSRLPHNDLVYLAFRLALQETLSALESQRYLDDPPDGPAGYLAKVTFLAHVALPVQVELLAETWSRHIFTEPLEATLFDAAIVFAACATAAQIAEESPQAAGAYARRGPRRLAPRVFRNAAVRLEGLFDAFWQDDRFLLLDDLQDLPPEEATAARLKMHIKDADLLPMYGALARWNAALDVADNLQGLLTEIEIAAAVPLLRWKRTDRSYRRQR